MITDFAPGVTAAASELLGFSARSIGSSFTTNDSTLLLHTGATIKSHTISNGIVTFNDGTGIQSLITLGDVAAATQYLAFNDWGNAGASLAFTATLSGTTHTFVYTQTTSLPGITNAAMVDLVNVSATSIVTNGTTLSVLDETAPNAPSITAIPENGGGGINAAEASDGTPVVVSLSGTGAISNDTLTINWGGQTVNYTLLAGDILAGSVTVTVPAGTITTQGNGTFNVTARLTDGAGNASANSTATSVTVDTVAPTAPSITSIPENGGGGINASEASNGTPVVVGLTGTGAAAGDTLTVNWGGQTVTYTLLAGDISGNSATVTVPAGTITTQGNGTFNVTARLTDVAGNVGANSTATSVTVDTVAPAAPSITAIPENGGGGINAAEASNGTPVVVGLTGTGAVAGDTLTVNWGGQTVTYTLLAGDISGNSATVTVPLATITAQGQGTVNVTARLTDAAGNASANSSATSVTVDTVAPTPPSITSIAENSGGGINAAEASNGTPVVVGLAGTGAVAGDTLTVVWGGQTVNYTLLAGDISGNSATVTVPAGTITTQGDGTFNVTAALTDAVGNASANSSATSVTVDTVAPTAPSITAIPENGGGGINAAEASDGTPVVVGLAGTGAVAGDTLTVNWGGQTVNYTLLAADISGNSATVTVPAGDDHGAGPGHVQRDGRADRRSGQRRRELDGDPGNGRHGGADGGGGHHGDCHRQRHLVERLYHQRHDADGVGHARRARLRRDGAGQQRRRRQLVRCHHQHGQHLELYRSRRRTARASPTRCGSSTPWAMSMPTPPARR